MRFYHPEKTPASNLLTDLIRAVLCMSAHAQKVGTILTRDLNLSSAQWQTLGELTACHERLTVSQLARRMGLARQSVQRLINEMAEDGLVQFVNNPDDRRVQHVILTYIGKETYQNALEREWQWTNELYLVRPDGYIGARVSPTEVGTLSQYATRWIPQGALSLAFQN